MDKAGKCHFWTSGCPPSSTMGKVPGFMWLTWRTVLFLLLCIRQGVWGHGRMIDPPMRSSMWRFGFNTPVNYDDNGLNCGGFINQHQFQNGRCGVCGDPSQGPKLNEYPGKYATGVIGRRYLKGQVIPVTLELTSNHRGYFEFRLCPVNSPNVTATQECFDRNVLNVVGSGPRYIVTSTEPSLKLNVSCELPATLTCSQCVIQWLWVGGQHMGLKDGHECLGCGEQEQWHNCADVSIEESIAHPMAPSWDQPAFPKMTETVRIPSTILSRPSQDVTKDTHSLNFEGVMSSNFVHKEPTPSFQKAGLSMGNPSQFSQSSGNAFHPPMHHQSIDHSQKLQNMQNLPLGETSVNFVNKPASSPEMHFQHFQIPDTQQQQRPALPMISHAALNRLQIDNNVIIDPLTALAKSEPVNIGTRPPETNIRTVQPSAFNFGKSPQQRTRQHPPVFIEDPRLQGLPGSLQSPPHQTSVPYPPAFIDAIAPPQQSPSAKISSVPLPYPPAMFQEAGPPPAQINHARSQWEQKSRLMTPHMQAPLPPLQPQVHAQSPPLRHHLPPELPLSNANPPPLAQKQLMMSSPQEGNSRFDQFTPKHSKTAWDQTPQSTTNQIESRPSHEQRTESRSAPRPQTFSNEQLFDRTPLPQGTSLWRQSKHIMANSIQSNAPRLQSPFQPRPAPQLQQSSHMQAIQRLSPPSLRPSVPIQVASLPTQSPFQPNLGASETHVDQSNIAQRNFQSPLQPSAGSVHPSPRLLQQAPQSFQSLPRSSRPFPQSLQTSPESFVRLPQHTHLSPQLSRRTPQPTSIPQRSSGSFQTFQSHQFAPRTPQPIHTSPHHTPQLTQPVTQPFQPPSRLDLQDPRRFSQDSRSSQQNPDRLSQGFRSSQQDPRPIQQDPRSIQQDLRSVQQDPRSVQQDLRSVQQDSRSAQQDPRSVQQDPRSVRQDPRSVRQDLRSVPQDLRSVQQDPRTVQQDSRASQQNPRSVKPSPETPQNRPANRNPRPPHVPPRPRPRKPRPSNPLPKPSFRPDQPLSRAPTPSPRSSKQPDPKFTQSSSPTRQQPLRSSRTTSQLQRSLPKPTETVSRPKPKQPAAQSNPISPHKNRISPQPVSELLQHVSGLTKPSVEIPRPLPPIPQARNRSPESTSLRLQKPSLNSSQSNHISMPSHRTPKQTVSHGKALNFGSKALQDVQKVSQPATRSKQNVQISQQLTPRTQIQHPTPVPRSSKIPSRSFSPPTQLKDVQRSSQKDDQNRPTVPLPPTNVQRSVRRKSSTSTFVRTQSMSQSSRANIRSSRPVLAPPKPIQSKAPGPAPKPSSPVQDVSKSLHTGHRTVSQLPRSPPIQQATRPLPKLKPVEVKSTQPSIKRTPVRVKITPLSSTSRVKSLPSVRSPQPPKQKTKQLPTPVLSQSTPVQSKPTPQSPKLKSILSVHVPQSPKPTVRPKSPVVNPQTTQSPSKSASVSSQTVSQSSKSVPAQIKSDSEKSKLAAVQSPPRSKSPQVTPMQSEKISKSSKSVSGQSKMDSFATTPSPVKSESARNISSTNSTIPQGPKPSTRQSKNSPRRRPPRLPQRVGLSEAALRSIQSTLGRSGSNSRNFEPAFVEPRRDFGVFSVNPMLFGSDFMETALNPLHSEIIPPGFQSVFPNEMARWTNNRGRSLQSEVPIAQEPEGFPGSPCLDGSNLKCRGRNEWAQIPNFDKFCATRCKSRPCSTNMCECTCPSEVVQQKVCRSNSDFASMNKWCEENCMRGNCPPQFCTCR